jgi:hypothetical protein
MKLAMICIAALTLSSGAWAHGPCGRGNAQGQGQGQSQGQAQRCGQCKRGNGQKQGPAGHCPNCAKAQTGNAGGQQGAPAK